MDGKESPEIDDSPEILENLENVERPPSPPPSPLPSRSPSPVPSPPRLTMTPINASNSSALSESSEDSFEEVEPRPPTPPGPGPRDVPENDFGPRNPAWTPGTWTYGKAYLNRMNEFRRRQHESQLFFTFGYEDLADPGSPPSNYMRMIEGNPTLGGPSSSNSGQVDAEAGSNYLGPPYHQHAFGYEVPSPSSPAALRGHSFGSRTMMRLLSGMPKIKLTDDDQTIEEENEADGEGESDKKGDDQDKTEKTEGDEAERLICDEEMPQSDEDKPEDKEDSGVEAEEPDGSRDSPMELGASAEKHPRREGQDDEEDGNPQKRPKQE